MNKQKDIWTEENIVNAFYAPHLNEFQINTGILESFGYSNKNPKSLNYGGSLSVFGHELTHGFDSNGRNYGPLGI